ARCSRAARPAPPWCGCGCGSRARGSPAPARRGGSSRSAPGTGAPGSTTARRAASCCGCAAWTRCWRSSRRVRAPGPPGSRLRPRTPRHPGLLSGLRHRPAARSGAMQPPARLGVSLSLPVYRHPRQPAPAPCIPPGPGSFSRPAELKGCQAGSGGPAGIGAGMPA
uniref:Uncharacterized protein n=1 Tax=Chelydra serpentina TaxID=8475 RepID=A0A8C3XQZ5_CHESE